MDKIIALVLFFSLNSFSQDKVQITLENKENIRKIVSGVLEVATLLPKGSIIELPSTPEIVQYDFRDSAGNVQRSSNGFYSKVKIRTVPGMASTAIEKLNSVSGGLFITATLRADESEYGDFSSLPESDIMPDYLKTFHPNGKPRFELTSYFSGRFGKQLNKVIKPSELTAEELKKSQLIMQELSAALDRTRSTSKNYLFIDKNLARQYSMDYETIGTISDFGAWSIAVKSTAPRHGFAHVPCAEFVSELIRQAYKRAGYDVFKDFNSQKKNKLIWTETAAVVKLAQALFIAGWIPWELSKFKPLAGAPTMHFKATSPGHAYIAAGMDGRFIVDNGSPEGRDLGKTSDKIINMMYLGGVFFLPPGINPEAWEL